MSQALILNPCPFCGGQPKMCYQLDDLGDYCVQCDHCGAKTCPHDIRYTKEEAALDWNTRRIVLLDPDTEASPVAGHMEMTHADFQRACRVELDRLQTDPNCDTRLIYLLCEAVRCSREACDLARVRLDQPERPFNLSDYLDNKPGTT